MKHTDSIYIKIRRLLFIVGLSACIATTAYSKTTKQLEDVVTSQKSFTPLLAVKSNLLYWIGVMPDFKHYSWTPNLSVEYFFADRWSINGSGAYAKRKVGSDQYYGISAWSLEPRIWLNADGTYRWLYAGLYGEAGDFDNQRMHIDDYQTGKFGGLGISLGAYIPVTERLGAEVGLRAGYSRRSIDYYTPENGHDYFDYNKKRNKFGITGINISIVYRFGK